MWICKVYGVEFVGEDQLLIMSDIFDYEIERDIDPVMDIDDIQTNFMWVD